MQECGCNHSSNIVTTDSKRSKKENMFDLDVEVQIHVLQDFGFEAILLYELAIACHISYFFLYGIKLFYQWVGSNSYFICYS